MAEDFWIAKVLTADFGIDYFLESIGEYCFDEAQISSIKEKIEWRIDAAKHSICGGLYSPDKIGKHGNIYVNNEPYLLKDEFKPPISGTILGGIHLDRDDAWNGEIFYETTAEYIWFVYRG